MICHCYFGCWMNKHQRWDVVRNLNQGITNQIHSPPTIESLSIIQQHCEDIIIQLELLHDNIEREQEKHTELHGNNDISCLICSTTDTPLWRKGPRGKNTFCNACGICFSKKVDEEIMNLELEGYSVSTIHQLIQNNEEHFTSLVYHERVDHIPHEILNPTTVL